MQKITPFLLFDGAAEEAVNFYASIFRNSKVSDVSRGPNGTFTSVTFSLDGQEFIALNGGPQVAFTPAISFFVNCDTQEEVDEYWEKLLQGGEPLKCGWLKDKYGLSWQIIPAALGKLMRDKDPEKSRRVMEAMMKMVKIDTKGLQEAYDRL